MSLYFYERLQKVILLSLIYPSLAIGLTDLKSIEEKSLANNLGHFKHLEINTDEGRVDIYSVKLNSHYSARISQQTTTQLAADSLDDFAIKNKAIVAINGGFYTPVFEPVGLFIENGKKVTNLIRSSILPACVQIKQGKITIESIAKNCTNSYNAIQTGPLLIDHYQISKNLQALYHMKLKSDFLAEHRRTIIAETDDHKIILIATSPITLRKITEVLLNNTQDFGVNKIKKAINLDGGSSTGMYVGFTDKPFYFSEYRNVKTAFLITDVNSA